MDIEEYHPSVAAVGHEEIGSSCPTCATSKEIQSSPGFRSFKCKDDSCFTCPEYITEHKFKCNIIQKTYNIRNYFK